ncbi:MAG: ferredoxin reductase [Afipia sp.]|nr:ferredoxin reductase [Afipia sp.]
MNLTSAASRKATVWQPATITDIVARSGRVKSFFLKPSKPFSYSAGQHGTVRLTAADGYRAQRNYSIASAPEQGEIVELAIEHLDGGEVSGFFHNIAMAGDEIELKAPIGGHFIWSVADGGPIVLIGGGSGVVPLVSMLRHRALNKSNVPVVLLYSSREWDEMIFRDEIFAAEERNDGFKFVLTTTRDKARRKGDHERRIDAAMIVETLAKLPGAPAQCFVCGSNPFVEMAAHHLMDANVSPKIIRTERFGV